MQAKITVRYLEGPSFEAETMDWMATADQVAFERHFNVGLGQLTQEGHQRSEYLAFFAWRVLRRTHGEARSFETWADQVADLDIAQEQSGVDPTAQSERAGMPTA